MDPLKTFCLAVVVSMHVQYGVSADGAIDKVKMCPGFKSCKIGGHSIHEYNYKKLKEILGSSCTHVQGNVVIQGLQKLENGTDPDLSFLDTIQEISGCLLVASNSVSRISLKNLRIIRGQQAFERKLDGNRTTTRWAVYVSANQIVNIKESVVTYPPALNHLDLRSLRSIQNYGVLFESNIHLCYPQYTVYWPDIFERPSQEIKIEQDRSSIAKFCKGMILSVNSSTSGKFELSNVWDFHTSNYSCSSECTPFQGKRFCWGEGPDMCQTMSKCQKRSCSFSNHCFMKDKTKEEECCHPQCVAGCRGGTARDCLACREFLNDGECVRSCPASKIYDKQLYQYKPNPDRRLAWGPFCVLNCSEGYYEHEDSCVASCDKNNYIIKGNKCVPCNDMCPKKCKLSDLMKKEKEKDPKKFLEVTYTTRTALKLLSNCTAVIGNINIIPLSKNDKYHKQYKDAESVRPEDLMHLRNIKEFTGVLNINLKAYPEITNTSFIESLEVIKGPKFIIAYSKIKYIGLPNLKQIDSKVVIFALNPDMCYVEEMKKSVKVKYPMKIIRNKPTSSCAAEGKVCDPACRIATGCRGPGPFLCGFCTKLKAGNQCVNDCSHSQGFYFANTTKATHECMKCHPECKLGCKGPGPLACVGGCKNFQDGPRCVKTCPIESKFGNKSSGRCEECHPACQSKNSGNKMTCTGGKAMPGPSGCTFCEYILMKGLRVEKCLIKCPPSTYRTLLAENEVDPDIAKYIKPDITKVCRSCHPECAVCDTAYDYDCPRCVNFRYKRLCVSRCPPEETYSVGRTIPGAHSSSSSGVSRYSGGAGEKECLPCHDFCRGGCSGPSQTDCKYCKKVKVYLNDEKTKWNCTVSCPLHLPYKENEPSSGDTICVIKSQSLLAKESRQRIVIIASVVPATIIVIVIAIIIICCVLRTRDLARKERMRLKAKFTGALRDEENVPLTINPAAPSAPPNQSLLRIINGKELARGNIIGSGAFGTVFRGKWYPPKEKEDSQQVCIDVAVKILSDVSDPALSAEFLEEARVMATVQNPYVMALFGVCMTAQLQLVSRYMPHGSLLEYIRRRHSTVKSKALVTWALQIAKGMEYLESMKIIHRDLAARNVLVQEENHVRITDFGLAKLVDTPEGFQSNGGKMPVKWLALECIRHRRFSHKSDVWAYGITLWELFTFGQRPYGNLSALQMCEYLERGERLQQPEICTLDVYMLMIKCWMPDEESRPSFREIVEEMARMSNDPSRFLVIQNDNHPRRHLSSMSSNSGGYSAPSRSQRPSQNSDEEKSGGCSYVPSCPSPLPASPAPAADDRHRHLTAAARRDRKAAAARYAVDPLSSSSPPASSSTAEDDYLEPHHNSIAPSPYINTGGPSEEHSGHGEVPFEHTRIPSTDNPEYFGPPSSESFPYYNEEVFRPTITDNQTPHVKYANCPFPSEEVEDSSV